ncbi:MAG TPA: AMP-binding protein [Candidatus Dormibacteraeota bacterium]|nr:AMP-binding protein [Candidatus Dormibacteraeota bacterium]
MRTVSEICRWWARRQPGLEATWFEGRARTWGELDLSSSKLAAGLVKNLGVKPGDHVAILDKNTDDYIELLFALDKAGAIATPVNWRLTGTEVAKVAADAQSVAIVAGEEFRSQADAAGTRVLGFGELPRMDSGDPHLDEETRTSWQLYTSGTTGLPKGAMLSGLNLFATAGVFGTEVPELRVGGRAMVAMPLYHIGGCGWAMAAMVTGSTAVLLREFLPQQVLQVFEEQRVETAFLVPAALLFLTSLPESQGRDYSSLRNILYGASPISQAVLQRSIDTFRCHLTQVYGLTETTGAITFLAHHEHAGERMLSCGRATLGADMKVVDPDDNEVPHGEIGEIVYRGGGTMEGYWKRPQDTADVIRDGWFHTGDAGTQDADGYFYIKDRIKDMIVSGGENIYPAELESVLAGHPAIADVAVIGVPDDQWGETVKAVVVRRPGAELVAEELIEWSRPLLAGYKRPRTVDFVETIPRNPSGKILKRELRQAYWEGAARQVN